MAIVLFPHCVSQIESILVAQRCCFVIIHLMVGRKAGRVVILNTYEGRNYYYFFPSSEKTRADFRAGGKEPDAIDKLINLQIITRVTSQVNSE